MACTLRRYGVTDSGSSVDSANNQGPDDQSSAENLWLLSLDAGC
jgi:hypothetical protein